MKEMMRRDFDFEIDGVLFYHASVHYRKGQSPLGLFLYSIIFYEEILIDILLSILYLLCL